MLARMEGLRLVAHAPWMVQVHLAAVLPAFVLGAWLFVAPKGGKRHRAIGKAYLGLMLVAALSSVGLHAQVGPAVVVGPLRLGLLHLLVPLTLRGTWMAFQTIRRGDIQAHKRHMLGLYLGALVVAGLLSFAPGRLLHRAFFG
jgi:uncharacterized membrane protein